ncbi:DUF3488 and transglutaminase-like domain-containing protein [Halorussus salilacus]|uniref:transglutaminase TgpA family protein n=1 Tax=Halorussus salilacus TaxID=2953750 RepID=UPI00209C9DD2|nr:transglutaminaseTgpA domain-containing protein [Halorussus salilacus]USZ67073.1 DUF3488 and transglutaminase-like domain-containing protein [Halorussus salilacus]
MSAPTDASVGRALDLGDASVPYHRLAVGSTAVLMATYLGVLYHVTDVVGGTTALLALVAGTLLAGALVARRLRPLQAGLLGGGLLAVGLVAYYLAVPSAYVAAGSVGKVVADNVALLTGLSVLRMTEVGAWALGVAPGLAFGPWYLVLRRRYALAVAAGGAALGFFVLTGDAGSFATLVGSLAGAATLGFGTLARRGGTPAQADTVAVVLVAMVVVSSTVSVVPGGAASPVLPGGSGGSTPTVEASAVTNDDRTDIVGAIRLSPEVRFRVEADESRYWRVGAYDRYDGGGWIRTGEVEEYGPQGSPPGETETVTQTVTVETDSFDAMPAAYRPTELVEGDESNTRVTAEGSFDPVGTLRDGERYAVVSRTPDPDAEDLETAGTDYPTEVEQRYLQLPDSSEDRIRERTDEITADAETPHAKAVAVEDWLESNKGYSLSVDRPEGDVAEEFIFEMDEGYCTYYATSMVAMLRSQGVPARYAVGYTPGQRVAEDEWVVRGLDSHAWVEVYFPDVGWVEFDPTPAEPRERAESAELEGARESDASDVDTDESAEGTWTTTETPTTATPTTTESGTDSDGETTATATDPDTGDRGGTAPDRDDLLDPEDGATTGTTTATTGTTPTASGPTDDEGVGVPMEPPSREGAALAALVAVGLAAAARRTGLLARVRRTVWLYWQPREDPETDVSRAFDRLEHALGRERRERRPGETPREYLAAMGDLDDRVERVGRLHERVRYAGERDADLADEAVALVNELIRERRPLG